MKSPLEGCEKHRSLLPAPYFSLLERADSSPDGPVLVAAPSPTEGTRCLGEDQPQERVEEPFPADIPSSRCARATNFPQSFREER